MFVTRIKIFVWQKVCLTSNWSSLLMHLIVLFCFLMGQRWKWSLAFLITWFLQFSGCLSKMALIIWFHFHPDHIATFYTGQISAWLPLDSLVHEASSDIRVHILHQSCDLAGVYSLINCACSNAMTALAEPSWATLGHVLQQLYWLCSTSAGTPGN